MKSIIITIQDKNHKFQYDLDVPTNVLGESLKGQIFETLDEYVPEYYLDRKYHTLYLNKQRRELQDNETLGQAGVMNGDYLTIISKLS